MPTAGKGSDGLTPKQKRFCEEFIKDYNATKAYMRAYEANYDTANAKAYKLVKNECVKAYLDKLEREVFEEMRINADHIATELAKLAFNDSEISKKDKMKAIELLQKQLGLQQQKIQADVSTDISINIEE